jgi:pimeloyl-ACP methyl ester carboxylesterase
VSEISAARYRAGEGEPLLLLHGFTATWRCWRPVLAELVARYDVLAPTLTGHDGGRRLTAGQAHTLSDAAGHVEEELDAQGIDTAHIVGNSMGGTLALELAKRGRARSIVALSPGGGWHHGDPEGERVERFFRRQLRVTRATEGMLERIMRRPGARRLALRDTVLHGELLPPDEAVALARSSLACEVVEEVFAAIRTGEGLLRDLDQVRVPTLIAWAERDRILPRERHEPRFRDEIPGVTLRVLPGVGHMPMSDHPALVAATIVGWVDAHRTSAVSGAVRDGAGGAAGDGARPAATPTAPPPQS